MVPTLPSAPHDEPSVPRSHAFALPLRKYPTSPFLLGDCQPGGQKKRGEREGRTKRAALLTLPWTTLAAGFKADASRACCPQDLEPGFWRRRRASAHKLRGRGPGMAPACLASCRSPRLRWRALADHGAAISSPSAPRALACASVSSRRRRSRSTSRVRNSASSRVAHARVLGGATRKTARPRRDRALQCQSEFGTT